MYYYFNYAFYHSHYFIVVINATKSDIFSTTNIEEKDLGPHATSKEYYVAAVLLSREYDPARPFVLGDGKNTIFNDITYTNVPISLGIYRYFVRAYTIKPVSLLLYNKK